MERMAPIAVAPRNQLCSIITALVAPKQYLNDLDVPIYTSNEQCSDSEGCYFLLSGGTIARAVCISSLILVSAFVDERDV